MEIDKTLQFDAAPAAVWALLLDPVAMGACVPGMQAIEVVSEDEYIAQMQVKISFISANFKLRTRIVERDAPNYLRAEGTGEDTKVASSLKQSSEMWLSPRENGGTQLRMKVKADVFGRMGAFGLNVMKTKADRLWDEFGVNAAARLAAQEAAATQVPVLADMAATPAAPPAVQAAPASAPILPIPTVPAIQVQGQESIAPASAAPPSSGAAPIAGAAASTPPGSAHTMARTSQPDQRMAAKPQVQAAPAGMAALQQPQPGFWARLFGAVPASTDIRVEVRRGDTLIKVQWPVQAAAECTAWLRSLEP